MVAEAIRRARVRSTWGDHLLFGPQRDYCLDRSKSKLGLCSRRAGKTTGNAWMLVDEAQHRPRAPLPYVTLTRKSQSARAMWSELDRLNDEHKLGAHLNHIEKVFTLPNKAYIFIAGADDARTIERLRGDKAPGIVVDEAQAFGPRLQGLIEDVLEPSTADYDGWIALSGTPGRVCAGYFHDACTGKVPGWDIHRWTILDNPHIPHAADWLARLRAKRQWEENHPTYLREWRGIWVDDPNGTVYRMAPGTLIQELPKASDWRYVLGIDVGYTDACAFAVLAWSLELRKTVVVECWSRSEMTPSDVAETVAEMRTRYDFDVIVVDPGGGGKGYGEEMRQRHQIPTKTAQKAPGYKIPFIDFLNGELRAGHLQAVGPKCEQLIHEWRELPWNEDRTKEDRSLVSNHCADATLYAWRECKAWLPREREATPELLSDQLLGPRPAPGPDDMARYWEEREQRMEQERRDPWGLEAPPDDWA